MMVKIGQELAFVDLHKRGPSALEESVESENAMAVEAYREFEGKFAKAEKTIVPVDAFHGDIIKHWSAVSQRVLGHVVYAPFTAVGTCPKQFTEEQALIELDRDKINCNNFRGNVVSLGRFDLFLLRSSTLTVISSK